MGYTHYWTGKGRTIDANAWKRCLDDCAKVIALSPVPLAIERDEGCLLVNGFENSGVETFCIPDNPLVKDFVKTERAPYDIVITACLCLFAEAGLFVESDGSVTDWDAGADLATQATGRTVAIPNSIRLE